MGAVLCAELYLKGLILVLFVFPVFTFVYDRDAYKQDNWGIHMLAIMLAYPATIPLLGWMRLKSLLK